MNFKCSRLLIFLLTFIIANDTSAQNLRYVSRLQLNLDSFQHYLDSVVKHPTGLVYKNGQEVEDSASLEEVMRIAHTKLLAGWVRIDSITSPVTPDSSSISAREHNEDGSLAGSRLYKIDSQFTYHRKESSTPWLKMKLHKVQLLETTDTKVFGSTVLVKFETTDKKRSMWVQKKSGIHFSPLPYPIGSFVPGLVYEYFFVYDKLIVSGHLVHPPTK